MREIVTSFFAIVVVWAAMILGFRSLAFFETDKSFLISQQESIIRRTLPNISVQYELDKNEIATGAQYCIWFPNHPTPTQEDVVCTEDLFEYGTSLK
jgi:hypothetical protein